ncbi:MAG: murein biosynthesis integral membrane protein MurJ [Alphaproteobacteria bacterium]
MSSFIRSAVTVGGWTMGSRVLGFVRDIMIANFLGAGPVADAFFVAFKFPNFFRRLFAEGAFNAAFVPQFAGSLAADGLPAARRLAEDTLAVLLSVLLPFTLLAQIFMPQLMVVLAPGFRAAPATFALAVELTRLTFPYLMFMALAALLGGMLNSRDRFTAPAAAPIVLNIILIAAMLVLRDRLATPGHALAWGVAVAGMAQFLLLVGAAGRAEMSPRLRWPRLTPPVRKILRLMVPGAIGAGVVQINLVVDTILASTLPAGSMSYLYFADRVNQLPLGVVGVAIGIVLLPLLTRQLRIGDSAAANDSQNRAIEIALLLTVPAAAALLVIAGPIVRVLFLHGAFAPAAAAATAGALTAFAVGLPAYVLTKSLNPGFFAREDTATPVKIAALAVALNIALALILMQFLAHVGIALATALSAWVNAGLLGIILHRRGHLSLDERLRTRLPRIVLAAGVMALVLWLGAGLLAPVFARPGVLGAIGLAALIGAGMVAYLGAALLFRATRWFELRRIVRR